MEFFAKSDVGRKRKNNEDSYLAKKYNDCVSLFIVADGLGGYLSGEVASKILVESVSKYIEENLSRIVELDEKKVCNMIEIALTFANEKIFKLEKTDEKYKGMGTTVVLVLKVMDKVYYTSVGDSRLYQFDDKLENICQITVDDTYVNELIRKNVITKEDAKTHPQRHMLTKAVGVVRHVNVKVELLEKSNGYLLLCSDGVTNMLKDKELLEILRENKLSLVVEKIIETANSNGGSDNITAIVIKL